MGDTVLPVTWNEGGVLKQKAAPTPGFWHTRSSLGCLSTLGPGTADPGGSQVETSLMVCSRAAEFAFGRESDFQTVATVAPPVVTEQARGHAATIGPVPVHPSTDRAPGVSPGQYSKVELRDNHPYLARVTNAHERVAHEEAQLAAAPGVPSPTSAVDTEPVPEMPGSAGDESDSASDEL